MNSYQQIADDLALDTNSLSKINYGQPPKIVLAYNDSNVPTTREMMCYLYLPVKMQDIFDVRLPKNLEQYREMITDIRLDSYELINPTTMDDYYIYLTVKHLYVNPGNPGNREGWHADGYGSNGDLNYIMHSTNPTEFAVQHFGKISTDDRQSMIDMEEQIIPEKIMTFPNNALLRLDESIIHRVGPVTNTGMRTFVKVTMSQHKFNLEGNAHNYDFDYDWDMHSRSVVRNLDNGADFSNKDYVKV